MILSRVSSAALSVKRSKELPPCRRCRFDQSSRSLGRHLLEIVTLRHLYITDSFLRMTIAGDWRTNPVTSPYPDWELFSALPRKIDFANRNPALPTATRRQVEKRAACCGRPTVAEACRKRSESLPTGTSRSSNGPLAGTFTSADTHRRTQQSPADERHRRALPSKVPWNSLGQTAPD